MELEGYQFERLLGEGQASTWLARRVSDGARVVIKTLHLERVDDWKGIELFEREAQTLRQLDHPAIPKFIDFRETKTRGISWHIVQSYVEGQTADKWGEQGVTESSLREFAVGVLEAIEYLQDFSPPLLHRDIKPQNIVVNQEQVYVVDFGSVRHIIPSRAGGSTVAGTSGYMAPEQLMGRADQSSDLFGLGMTLVRLVTGVEPNELPKRRMKTEWRDSKKMVLSKSFETFIDRLIEPQPGKRFPNARSAIAGMNTVAPPSALLPRHRDELTITETDKGMMVKSGLSVFWVLPFIGGVLLFATVGIVPALAVLFFPEFPLPPIVILIFVGCLIALTTISAVLLAWAIMQWAGLSRRRTHVEFIVHRDRIEAVIGEVFKEHHLLSPVEIMRSVDKDRHRVPLKLSGLELTGPLSYRDRVQVWTRLKAWAEPRIDAEKIPRPHEQLNRSNDD